MDIRELMEDIDGMREHEGTSVPELCRAAHISPKSYRHWMSGTCAPNFDALNDVLEALHITLVPVYTEQML